MWINYFILIILLFIFLLNLVFLFWKINHKKNTQNFFAMLEKLPEKINEKTAENVKNYFDLAVDIKTKLTEIDNFLKSDFFINKLDLKTSELKNDLQEKTSQFFLSSFKKNNDLFNDNLKNINQTIDDRLKNLISYQNNFKKDFVEVVNHNLKVIQGEIDKKLQSELQKKLSDHFETMKIKMTDLSQNLIKFESVEKAIISLNDTFSGSKQRGNFGEYSLETILNDFLGQQLFYKQKNLKTLEKKSELKTKEKDVIFDFVLKTNFAPGENKYLAIDAKFPLKTYKDLVDLKNFSDKNIYQEKLVLFKKEIKNLAKEVAEKYIVEGLTENFAFIYIPSEAIFNFLLTIDNLQFEIMKKYRIIIVSPVTVIPYLQFIKISFNAFNFKENISEIRDVFTSWSNTYANLLKNLESVSRDNKKIEEGITKAIKKVNLISKKTNILNEKIGLDQKKINIISQETDESSKIKIKNSL